MDKRELQDRTKQFALRVLNLVDALVGLGPEQSLQPSWGSQSKKRMKVCTGWSSSATVTLFPKASSRLC
jgi:hypothetical protein